MRVFLQTGRRRQRYHRHRPLIGRNRARNRGAAFFFFFLLRARRRLNACTRASGNFRGRLQQFDGDVMKWPIALIDGSMGKVSRSESDLTVLEQQRYRLLAWSYAEHVRIAQGHKQIIVPVTMHQARCLRRDRDVKNAHVLVLENQMMAGFGGYLDGLLLLGQSCCGQKQQARDPGRSHMFKDCKNNRLCPQAAKRPVH